MTGSASVVRNNETTPLKVKDDIYLNDVVQTGANSALGITFNDATTFNLKANTQITIDTYVYEDGGKNNAGVFDVAKGTAAFVAAAVAKTGDMKITTPTATLGIRGTTGLVEVPEGAAANNPNNVAIKLYPDADGKVGRIEVNDRAGARLGFLTQGASGFTIRPGAGGARVRRRAADDFAADDRARPGFCASGSLDAEYRPAGRATSSANSAAPIPASTAATRRAAGRSKTDCRDRIERASNRAYKIARRSRSPVSKTVPDNNCRTGRVNRKRRSRRFAQPAGSAIATAGIDRAGFTAAERRAAATGPAATTRCRRTARRARADQCADANRWPAALAAARRSATSATARRSAARSAAGHPARPATRRPARHIAAGIARPTRAAPAAQGCQAAAEGSSLSVA